MCCCSKWNTKKKHTKKKQRQVNNWYALRINSWPLSSIKFHSTLKLTRNVETNEIIYIIERRTYAYAQL